jgi:amphi-Trp domain-containing protein
MELIELSEKRTMVREEVAKLLHELADSLARNNGLDLMREGIKLRIDVPREVNFELEVEIESDESSIEIEISW